MHIFLDESGPFAVPKGQSSSISCVAALAVPDADLPALLTRFNRIVSGWQLGGTEPKGSRLSERQMDKVLTELGNFNVVLAIATIDMGQHSQADIEAHRTGQADLIRTSADGPSSRRHCARISEPRRIAWRRCQIHSTSS